MSDQTVVVVGGGIAGLAAAWELVVQAPGIRVVVLEAQPLLGGKILSADFAGRRVDLGADAFVARRPEARGLCDEIGLGDAMVAPGAHGASILVGGVLRPMPDGLALGVPTSLRGLWRSHVLSPRGLARAAVDLAGAPVGRRPGADGSVGARVRPRLGREVVERLTDPLIGGINAGSVDAMSAAMAFPVLLDAARQGGSLMRALRQVSASGTASRPGDPVFLRVRGGLTVLVEQLRLALVERGVEIRCTCPVDVIERGGDGRKFVVHSEGSSFTAEGVVVATPSAVGAQLLRHLDAELAMTLGGLRYASVTLATLCMRGADVGASLEGTGFVVARSGRGLLTACTYLCRKWPELRREDEVLLRVSAGRDGDDRHLELDDDAFVANAVDELRGPLQLTGAPQQAMVVRFEHSLPQFDVGHPARVDQVLARCDTLGALAPAGAWVRGVGIPACIGSGREAARRVLAHLGAAVS
ncbi:MAG: protoporphyrinogen oxidase [Acidimicrobiales bacterium]